LDIEVDDAILTEGSNGGRVWQVTYTVDGHVYSHVFPQSVFAWRVAEYDLDPNDVDALIEAVLYEYHAKLDIEHPMSLRNAPSIPEARKHYLAQINTVKAAGGIKTRKRGKRELRQLDPSKSRGTIIADNADTTATPLAMLKQHITIDPEHVAGMRAAVQRKRTVAAQH